MIHWPNFKTSNDVNSTENAGGSPRQKAEQRDTWVDAGVGQSLFGRNSKCVACKTVDKSDSIKFKTFCSERATAKKRTKEVVEQENILTDHISDNGLESRISFLNSQNEQ